MKIQRIRYGHQSLLLFCIEARCIYTEQLNSYFEFYKQGDFYFFSIIFQPFHQKLPIVLIRKYINWLSPKQNQMYRPSDADHHQH